MSLLQAAKATFEQVLDGPVVTSVKGLHQEMMTRPVPDDWPQVLRLTCRPRLWAACATERELLGNPMHLGQLELDGAKVTPSQFRRQVIEAIRDIKIKVLEADGHVNPFDTITISTGAMEFAVRTKTYFATMVEVRGVGPRLDAVEWRLLQEAVRSHGANYKSWMRAMQGIVHAVAKLRFQHLVNEF